MARIASFHLPIMVILLRKVVSNVLDTTHNSTGLTIVCQTRDISVSAEFQLSALRDYVIRLAL